MCSMAGGRWDESFPRTPSYREVTPAQPVVINLDQALARDNPSLRTTNPLRVSAGGLRLVATVPDSCTPGSGSRPGRGWGSARSPCTAATTGQHWNCGTGCPQRHHPATALTRGFHG